MLVYFQRFSEKNAYDSQSISVEEMVAPVGGPSESSCGAVTILASAPRARRLMYRIAKKSIKLDEAEPNISRSHQNRDSQEEKKCVGMEEQRERDCDIWGPNSTYKTP